MENTATAPAETAATESKGLSLKDAFTRARSAAKGAMGIGAVVLGGFLVASGLPLAMALGAAALYTGGRSVFESGKELLPLKAQSAISSFFTGKELTEITPVKQPSTVLGKVVRVAEYAALAFTGLAAFAAGAFAFGMGGGGTAAAALYMGGAGVLGASAIALFDRVVRGAGEILRHVRAPKAATPATETPKSETPDLSPAPAVATLTADKSFNNAATPEVVKDAPAQTPAPAIKPPTP